MLMQGQMTMREDLQLLLSPRWLWRLLQVQEPCSSEDA